MKVLLVAVVGSDNFGDEAMFKVAYDRLSHSGHDVTVATYKTDRAKERFPEVNFIRLPTLSRVEIYKCLVGIPARILNSSEYGALYVAGALNSIYFGHTCLLWSLVKQFEKEDKYVEFRPQSVGPFFGRYRWFVERMVRDIVKSADKFYVREKISYNYLREMNSTLYYSINVLFEFIIKNNFGCCNLQVPAYILICVCYV